MRIDAHQHYWRYDRERDAWITDAMAILRRDFLPGDIADEVAGTVAVQADQSAAETSFLLDLAAEHSFIRGVVGWVDLRAPDLREQLARWRDTPKLKGFRHIAQAEADDFLARPEVVRGIAVLGEFGYSYDILIYPRQLAAAETLVRQCPGVRFVLDHCAKPAIARGEIAEWRSGITRLGRLPNVSCKISGLVTEADWDAWKDADLRPYLDTVVDAFGVDRLLFGSDWPVCLLAATYRNVVGVVERWAERLTSAERASLFGGAAMTVYHLER
jgi:L-fuconolactonase